MNHALRGLLALVLVLGATGEAAAGFVTVLGDKGDGTVDVNGLPQDFTLTQLRAGVGGNNVRGLAPVLFFALPTLPSADSLVAAQLQISYLGISIFTVTTTPNFNADLFGLGTRSAPTVFGTDYFDGAASGSTDTLLAKGFVTPTTSAGTLSVSGTGFLGYIRSLYNADGTPIAAYAVFRLNADVHLPVNSGPYRGYEFGSGDNTDNGGAFVPQLQLTTVTPAPGGLTHLATGLVAVLLLAGYRLRIGRGAVVVR